MIIAYLFPCFCLFIVIYNIITIIEIFRRKIDPLYFKINLSLILNVIAVSIRGWLWLTEGVTINKCDFVWILIFMCLVIWYTYILASKSKNRA